ARAHDDPRPRRRHRRRRPGPARRPGPQLPHGPTGRGVGHHGTQRDQAVEGRRRRPLGGLPVREQGLHAEPRVPLGPGDRRGHLQERHQAVAAGRRAGQGRGRRGERPAGRPAVPAAAGPDRALHPGHPGRVAALGGRHPHGRADHPRARRPGEVGAGRRAGVPQQPGPDRRHAADLERRGRHELPAQPGTSGERAGREGRRDRRGQRPPGGRGEAGRVRRGHRHRPAAVGHPARGAQGADRRPAGGRRRGGPARPGRAAPGDHPARGAGRGAAGRAQGAPARHGGPPPRGRCEVPGRAGGGLVPGPAPRRGRGPAGRRSRRGRG
ncbi:MAG: Inner membrane protein YqiK, partial [uncultured Friedmanniella sp.]